MGDYSASLTFWGMAYVAPQVRTFSLSDSEVRNGPNVLPEDFLGTVSNLDIFFQVVDDSGSFTPNATYNPNPGNLSGGGDGENTGAARQDDNPNTGDSGLPALALLPVSGLAALGLILLRRKRA